MQRVEFINTGRILRPYAPVHLRSGRDASGNIFLQWTRRARLNAQMISYADVPLGEDSELYRIIVYTDNTYATAAMTDTSTTQAYELTTAAQTAAFGSPPAPGSIYFGITQLGKFDGYEARSFV